MTKPTPEQIRVFSRCCRAVILSVIVLVLIASEKSKVSMLLSVVSLIVICLGIMVLKPVYCRCPICRHPVVQWGRGPGRGGTFGNRCDKCDVDMARKRFARSLQGTWRSNLGGHDRVGMILTFRDDGTGIMKEWGFDHFYLDPEYVSVPDFQWKSVADQTIRITHRGRTREVKYDFKTRETQYGAKELQVFEVGLEPDEYGDVGFWSSPFSLVYQGQENRTAPKGVNPKQQHKPGGKRLT